MLGPKRTENKWVFSTVPCAILSVHWVLSRGKEWVSTTLSRSLNQRKQLGNHYVWGWVKGGPLPIMISKSLLWMPSSFIPLTWGDALIDTEHKFHKSRTLSYSMWHPQCQRLNLAHSRYRLNILQVRQPTLREVRCFPRSHDKQVRNLILILLIFIAPEETLVSCI